EDVARARFERINPVSLAIAPLLVPGRTIGTLSIARGPAEEKHSSDDLRLLEDLAARAALAVENARLLRRAEQAVDLRDEFLSVASHELRTPLQSILLGVAGLRQAVARPGSGDRLVLAIERQARRLSTLVGSLLDVARLTAGGIPLELEDVDLAE